MNTLRLARAAARSYPIATSSRFQRRGYADAVSDKIKLTLALPHQVRCPCPLSQLICMNNLTSLVNIAYVSCSCSPYTNLQMCMCLPALDLASTIKPLAEIAPYTRVQVNIPAESGEMGVLASHVPSIEQLKPGLVEVIEESGGSKQFFCMSNATRRAPLRFGRCRMIQDCILLTRSFCSERDDH